MSCQLSKLSRELKSTCPTQRLALWSHVSRPVTLAASKHRWNGSDAGAYPAAAKMRAAWRPHSSCSQPMAAKAPSAPPSRRQHTHGPRVRTPRPAHCTAPLARLSRLAIARGALHGRCSMPASRPRHLPHWHPPARPPHVLSPASCAECSASVLAGVLLRVLEVIFGGAPDFDCDSAARRRTSPPRPSRSAMARTACGGTARPTAAPPAPPSGMR